MSNRELPDISVGDFAMSLLKDMAKTPSQSLKPALKESTLQSANAPDVSRIEVSNDFVSLVTEGKKPQVSKPKPTKITESKEERLQTLINQLSGLLTEAKQIIQEMSPGGMSPGCTTTGNSGVNTAGSSKKKLLKKAFKNYGRSK